MDNPHVRKSDLLEKLKKDLINKLDKIINSFDGEIPSSKDSVNKNKVENILKLK